MPTKENSSRPLLISPRLEGENNREYAYRVLRQNIITLQFAPGQTLSEAELSEKLEMSRTPVHEAVMMLKNEWLVDVQAQRGSSVSIARQAPCECAYSAIRCSISADRFPASARGSE